MQVLLPINKLPGIQHLKPGSTYCLRALFLVYNYWIEGFKLNTAITYNQCISKSVL